MLLICYGTRPEWLKIKPLIDELNRENIVFKTLFTGQHANIVTSKADYVATINDSICSNRLNSIVSSALTINEHIFDGIDYVLVQGDTTSALTLALNAFHRNIKVIHLEAGLRTYDKQNPYPEEINRQLISRIAEIHFCPTKNNKNILKQEHCTSKTYVVGNTSLDNITNISTSYSNNVLVTLHRRENHDIIDQWFEQISKIALKHKELNFILPIHPNPKVQKYKHLLKGVNVIDPLEHNELISILANCKTAITDSGGIQEEASFFNKKIIVCRKITERQESVGVHSFICSSPNKLSALFKKINNDFKIKAACPYGNGNAAKKIVKILTPLLK